MSQNRDNDSMKERFDDEIFVALFRKGAHEYLQNDLLHDVPEMSDDTKSLSDAADKKIREMIGRAVRREKNKRMMKYIPRVAMIVLVVIAVCAITIMSVEALRVSVFNWFINTEEEITDIEFNQSQGLEDNYWADMFGYIPGGYELILEDYVAQGVTFIFANDSGEMIYIERYSDNGSYGIDTETAEYAEVMINDNLGFYSIKNGETRLVFTKDDYVYSIYAKINLSEIIKIAENIK